MSALVAAVESTIDIDRKDSSEVSGESQSTAASNSQPQNGDVSSVDANDGNQTPEMTLTR